MLPRLRQSSMKPTAANPWSQDNPKALARNFCFGWSADLQSAYSV
jgi:hypothetical protein